MRTEIKNSAFFDERARQGPPDLSWPRLVRLRERDQSYMTPTVCVGVNPGGEFCERTARGYVRASGGLKGFFSVHTEACDPHLA